MLEELDDLKKNETIPVYVELDDLNQEIIEAKVDKQTGMSMEALEVLESNLLDSEELQNASNEELETLFPKYFKDTESEREYIQGLVNERIMTERKIAKEMYDEQNEKYVEETGIDETEVQFISSYSPMVITECTEEEIDDIVVQRDVKSIDIHEDVEIVPESSVSEVSTTSSSNVTTAWKTAINSYVTTNTIGIKGKGVTVGVFDCNTVNKSQSDLINTDITVLDKAVDYGNNHGTKVTRVLAGTYGIVPKAKVYTCSTKSSQTTIESDIENLISHGVSLINMSMDFGDRETDYYTTFEKWLDHISFNHNVLVVIVSGNYVDAGLQCPIGTLAYNVLTVGGLNTKNTETFSDDTFHDGTSYGNGNTNGCAKPDCEAAFNDVLKEGWNGTSFAAPAVTGVCAQVIQTKPTLVFNPQITKAIIMASCDRKGTESYAGGLTAKEGSGVVNSQKAVIIASTERYSSKLVFPYNSNPTQDINFVKRGSPSKIVICWLTPSSTYGDDLSGYAESPGNYDFNLSVYSSKGTLLKESNVYNSSAEAVVFNSENDTLELRFREYYLYTNSAYEIGIAWY